MSGVKHDQGKLRMDLIPKELLDGVAEVLTFGAEKYSEHNWREGLDWSRCYGAMMRHMTAWWDGERNDQESGLSHLAHAGCCLAFLMTFEKSPRYAAHDDRYRPTLPKGLPIGPPITLGMGCAVVYPMVDEDSSDEQSDAERIPGDDEKEGAEFRIPGGASVSVPPPPGQSQEGL